MLLHGVLAIAGLSSLALAQPLYDLLRRSPEFFAIRELYMADVWVLVAVLAVVPTLVLSAPALVLRCLRPSWTLAGVAAAAGFAAALIALQATAGLGYLATTIAALVTWAGSAWWYLRSGAFRGFALLLSLASVVVPAFLVFDADVRSSAVRPPPAPVADMDADTGARAPIILVIFDEWSLTSILDRAGAIDRQRFPHLAALADRATWYPNATASADVSELALPAMLTGSPVRRGQLPTAAEHPVNLFTLLAPSHDLHAVEPITALCPPGLNRLAEPRPTAPERLGLLVLDLSLVWLRLTLPASFAERLPDVSQTWSGFGADGAQPAVEPSTTRPVARALFHLRRTDRAETFRRFVQALEPPGERPGFYFLHSLLPHVPWEYLPSGHRYRTRWGRIHGLKRELWTEDSWPVLHHRKRYLLQVEFMDRLIGELTARLELTGMFDRSLIAIAADHGVAFHPGKSRRLLDLADIESGRALDLANVPLLIKAPFQQRPEVDRSPVSLTGLPSLILELAGAEADSTRLPKAMTARPAMVGKYTGEVELAVDRESWQQSRLAEQAALLGESNDPMAIGARPELHGRPLTDFAVRGSDREIVLDNARAWDQVDPGQNGPPVLAQGVFDHPAPSTDRDVAVALNGVIAATVKPHLGPDGSSRIAAMLPEAGLLAGLNQVDVFLVEDEGGDLALEHVNRLAHSVYSLSRNQQGRVNAVVRRSRSALGASDRFRVTRLGPDGLVGRLDGGVETGITFQGWAIDRADPDGALEVVAFLAGRPFGTSPVALERPDVAERHGGEHLGSGFLLRPLTDAATGQRFGRSDGVFDAVRREGVVAYAVSPQGRALRLQFVYQPIERGRRGSETMPITDGRRLAVQGPGNGFDGSLDSVTRRKNAAGREATVIEGWAADVLAGERPRQIVIYRDGEYLLSLGTGRNRPDISDRLGDRRLLRTGFRGEVPDAPDPATFGQRHRVFAIMLRGAAVELPIGTPSDAAGEQRR